MAIVTSGFGFNSDNLDLNRLSRYAVNSNFFDNVNASIGGRVYPDIF